MDWSVVRKEHIEAAIKKFIAEKPKYPEPRSYYLIHEGNKLPSKYIRGLTYSIATGEDINLKGFNGGTETVKFFEKHGYVVEQITDDFVEIDYVGILNYLANNQEIPYSNPEAPNIDEDKKKKLLAIKQKGQNVVSEMKKIAGRCEKRYGLDKCLPGTWLDGSYTKTRKYLWTQMKYKEHENNPISISLFVEKNKDIAMFRVSLEIKNDGADKAIMQKYHSHLDMPIEPGMVYVAGSNEWGNPAIISDSNEVVKEKIANGILRKVQPSIYIEFAEDKTNEEYDAEILESVKRIMPYYDYVIEKKDSKDTTPVKSKIEYDKNMILYGPPGTGKTYSTAIYAVAICDGKDVSVVKAMDYNNVMIRYRELLSEGRVAFTTFHQSYGYEEFIEGIKPVMGENDNIGYSVEDGVFKAFCNNSKQGQNYVFVIDEINRGNISKIFGELITLLEDTKRAGMNEQASAILPYSGTEFSVPDNIYILGTMNTADRSIALMDTALRRRFQFVEMMPDADVLRKIGADKVQDLDVAAMLEKINERITFLYDREHTIGHAFFTKIAKNPDLKTLESIFKKSVIPLLQEYFYEDYQKIQLVLGDNGKSDSSIKFILDEEVKVKNIFKGNADDVIDLPEKKYSINESAFSNIESYKQII